MLDAAKAKLVLKARRRAKHNIYILSYLVGITFARSPWHTSRSLQLIKEGAAGDGRSAASWTAATAVRHTPRAAQLHLHLHVRLGCLDCEAFAPLVVKRIAEHRDEPVASIQLHRIVTLHITHQPLRDYPSDGRK